MRTEPHPPPLEAPAPLPASPFAQGHEEEEVGLASNRTSPKERAYGKDKGEEGAGREQALARIALNAALLALCCLFVVFCYRKMHPPAPTTAPDIVLPAQLPQELRGKEEEKVAPFEVRRTVWYYADNSEQQRDLRLLYEANNRRFSRLSNFSFVSLNKLTCRQYLSNSSLDTLDVLDTAIAGHPHARRILRIVTLLHILHQHGGVAISENLLMTEQLGWLEAVRSSPFLNGDFSGVRIEVVGFFAAQASSEPEVVEWGKWAQRQAICALALQNYFLAAIKGAHFLQELLKSLEKVLTSPQAMAAAQREAILHPSTNLFDLVFQNASLAILKEKGPNAAVAFGLAGINELYAPGKMERLLGKAVLEQRMALLSQLPLEELEDSFGQFRYFSLLRHEDELLLYLSALRQGRSSLMNSSFLRLFLLPAEAHYLYPNPEQEAAGEERWSALPKVVWVYSPEGLEQSEIVTMLLGRRIRQAALDARLEFREANDSNIHTFLKSETLDRIQAALQRPRGSRHPSSRSELVRLALLLENGGIFVDLSAVLVQGLEWVEHIAGESSGRIFDRCGRLPKCFLLWDPLASRPLAWKVAQQCNSKSPLTPTFLNGFIAAEPEALLLADWFEKLLSLLAKSQDEAEDVLEDCIGSREEGPEALAGNALSCVLEGRRAAMDAEIDGAASVPAHFYQLWSMSSLAQGKASPPGLVERDLLFEITQLPVEHLEEAGGPLLYFVRLTAAQREELTDFIIQHHERLWNHVHPESLVAKYVLGPADFQLAYEGGVLRVKPAQ